MNESSPTPAGIDTTVPSVARAYDYMLGGKDNFEVDRQFANSVASRDPELAVSIRLNKEFGRQVTHYMAEHGVQQFLDLGSGIPTSPPSVHDTAREVHPGARVVYVDNDPVVSAHNRALRAIGPGLSAIQADFTDPEVVLNHPELLDILDFDKPVGVLIMSVFQNTLDDEKVKSIMRVIRKRLAPGSYLAMSHVSDRSAQSSKDQIAAAIAKYGYPPTLMRTEEQIRSLFEGFELVEPGVVDYRDWRPAAGAERPHLLTQFYGAVGKLQ